MLAKTLLESIPVSIRTLRKLTVSSLGGEITFHQSRVLFLIREGFGQAQIAEIIQVTPAAVCKLMHQLSEKGFITMCPGKDRRERNLGLTKEGARALSSVSRQVEKKLNKGIDRLTHEERDDLSKGLEVLNKLMGQIKEG
jgi:DNA-binding MarR family transcriptional regulator